MTRRDFLVWSSGALRALPIATIARGRDGKRVFAHTSLKLRLAVTIDELAGEIEKSARGCFINSRENPSQAVFKFILVKDRSL